MTFIPSWEEFEKSAEMLYLRDPMNTRYSMKYSHSKGAFLVKITDNKKVLSDWRWHDVNSPNFFLPILAGSELYMYSTLPQCLQYKTEVQQDVRKIDNFISNLMRHMASNDK